jgi:hypothetical protein
LACERRHNRQNNNQPCARCPSRTSASIVVVLEALWERPAARPSTGLQPGQRWRPHWRAVAFKLVGLAAILGTIGLAQCVLSEYNKKLYRCVWAGGAAHSTSTVSPPHTNTRRPWFGLLRAAGPWAAAAGVAYVVAADGYQTDEARAADRCGVSTQGVCVRVARHVAHCHATPLGCHRYHNLGRLLLGQGSVVTMPRGTCANLTREWLVKAYFTPLMLAFAQNSVAAWDEQVGRAACLGSGFIGVGEQTHVLLPGRCTKHTRQDGQPGGCLEARRVELWGRVQRWLRSDFLR